MLREDQLTPRELTAALFVLGLSFVSAMIGWAVADVLGLIVGMALGLFLADLITRALERPDARSVVTTRRR